MKNDLVFCDIETTGLDWEESNAIEIAYMTQDMVEPVVVIPSAYRPAARDVEFPWSNAAPKAMEINKFYERYPDGVEYSGDDAVEKMINVLESSTLTGANIRFDARFIEKFLGFEPWHHRLFDLQAYAAGIFGHATPMGWKEICDLIVLLNSDSPGTYPEFNILPDHSAAADTISVKNAYNWLLAYKEIDNG